MEIKKIKIYQTKEGKEPFRNWFLDLDNTQKVKIQTRLKRLEAGYFGLFRKLQNGIFELKFDSGIRIYFSELDKVIILLLTGGNKTRQSNGIKTAENYLKDYIKRSREND